jgi:hypothetical protein
MKVTLNPLFLKILLKKGRFREIQQAIMKAPRGIEIQTPPYLGQKK